MVWMIDVKLSDCPFELNFKCNKNEGKLPFLIMFFIGHQLAILFILSRLDQIFSMQFKLLANYCTKSLLECSSHNSIIGWDIQTGSSLSQSTLLHNQLPLLTPIEQDILTLINRCLLDVDDVSFQEILLFLGNVKTR